MSTTSLRTTVSRETTTVTDEPDATGAAPDLDVAALPGGVKSAIEAVLMVVDEPVTAVSLAPALEISVDQVVAALNELEEEYAAAHRGFTLRSVGGGWRVYSRPDYAPVV